MKYLLDTNVVSELMKDLPDQGVTSWVKEHDHRGRILPFDESAAWEWARYIQLAKEAGFSPPLIDSQIAATALAWGLQVVTRNEDDFPLMNVINPFVHE